MTTLAQVIGIGMDYHGTPDDAVGAEKCNLWVGNADFGGACASGFDVAKIAQMAVLVGGSAVLLALWVEVGAGRHAAVGVVPKFMHMESVQALGQATYLTSDFHGRLAALWTTKKEDRVQLNRRKR